LVSKLSGERGRAVSLQSPNPERDTGQAIGAPLRGPPKAFRDARADIVLQADRTEDGTKAGISFDATGSLGEWPHSLRARSTVVGQKVQPEMPQYREQFTFHAQSERVGIGARPDSRLHTRQRARLTVWLRQSSGLHRGGAPTRTWPARYWRMPPRCPRTAINSQRSPSASTREHEASARFEPASNAREHPRNA
jgi:hypothetical protein